MPVMPEPGRAIPGRRLRLQVVDLEGRLLWRRGEAAADALLQTGHQDAVAEPLPALPGLVDRHDRPATGRRASRVEDLALRQAVPGGLHRCDGCLVLLLRAAREVMHDPIRHARSPFGWTAPPLAAPGLPHDDYQG